MGVPSEGGIVSGPDASGDCAIVEARTEDEGTLSAGTERSSGEMSSTAMGSVFRAVVLAFAVGNLARGRAAFGAAFVTGENVLLVAYDLDESLYPLRVPQSRFAARRLAILTQRGSVLGARLLSDCSWSLVAHTRDARMNALCHATPRPNMGRLFGLPLLGSLLDASHSILHLPALTLLPIITTISIIISDSSLQTKTPLATHRTICIHLRLEARRGCGMGSVM